MINIKKVDDITKNAVYGFMRRCQKLLPCDNPYYNIPLLIKNICINYYWISEYFTSHGSNFRLNDKKNMVTNTGGWLDTAYGNIEIDSKPILYEWYFKIIQDGDIFIGIDSSNKEFINADFSKKATSRFQSEST